MTFGAPLASVAAATEKVRAAAGRVGAAPPLLLLALLAPPPSGDGRSLFGLPSLCPFRNLVGLPCPGCGITRSVVCAAHGHWREAVAFHPAGPLILALLVALTLDRFIRLARPGARRAALSQRLAAPLAGAAGICLLLLWAARLAGRLPSPP